MRAASLLFGLPLTAQVRTGELRLHVVDPSGLGVSAAVELLSGANQLLLKLPSNDAGDLDVPTLPFGFYRLSIEKPGFSPMLRSLEIRSPVPVQQTVQLAVAPLLTKILVDDNAELMDPYRPSSVAQIGSAQVDERVTSLPGRSVQDLVNTQPGWLYEGNGVLHPRGSEYQTQFVIDGLPLTDNRSPGFGPEIEADDLRSMNIYTAGFPAEYGRKLGGVVELNTKGEPTEGLHGEADLSGGSYATAQSFAQLQYVWGHNTLNGTGSGSRSSHYLNPVVPENFTNNGTTGDFSVRFARDLSENDRLSLAVRHELSRFEIPNEFVQQSAGQRQDGDNFETIGIGNYQHIFSANTLAGVSGYVRDNTNDLLSNASSTPIVATQHNDAREGYVKGSFFTHLQGHDLKVGFESDATELHENFAYNITDPSQFDQGTQGSLRFMQQRPDLEQAAFIEDLARLGSWTISAGLRWDHYQLLLNQNAMSPRLAVSRYVPTANSLFHFAYDRIFQTPSNENILLSSSAAITSLNPEVLRLPVQPSLGNYYEGGSTMLLRKYVRLNTNVFRRDMRNYADDDQLLNTAVSYPIAFRKAVVYGAEEKLELLRVGKWNGELSYSYEVGNVWEPVTGGLFLGEDATAALGQNSGHFPDSQDQRNTVRARVQYRPIDRVWVAMGFSSDSGLPFSFDGTAQDALTQYGSAVVDRVNFNRDRVDSVVLVNASASVDLGSHKRVKFRLQGDGTNLTNRLDVIDFGGLFSGNAIGPGRSYHLRLTNSF